MSVWTPLTWMRWEEGGASVHRLSLWYVRLWLIPSGCLFLAKWNKMEESELFTYASMCFWFLHSYQVSTTLCTYNIIPIPVVSLSETKAGRNKHNPHHNCVLFTAPHSQCGQGLPEGFPTQEKKDIQCELLAEFPFCLLPLPLQLQLCDLSP